MTGPLRLKRGDLEGLAAEVYIPKRDRAARHYADMFSAGLHVAKTCPETGMAWAHDLAALLVPLVPDGVTLVATPPAGRRRVVRGWYFARELGAGVARLVGVPLARPLRWLEEGEEASKAIITQAGKGRALGKGAVCDEDLTGERVCLVDDLYTTGITAELSAQALREAGAASVFVVTLGVTERTRWRPPGERERVAQRSARKRARQAGLTVADGAGLDMAAWRAACCAGRRSG